MTPEYEKQIEQENSSVGKGRGSKNRQPFVTEKVRYEVLNVTREIETIADVKEGFGWKGLKQVRLKHVGPIQKLF